jgi:hypothetical protein
MKPGASIATGAERAQSPSPSAAPDLRRAALVLAVLLGAAALVPIWALDFFPGQDTPNHLYAAHVLAHVEEPTFAPYFRFYPAMSNIAFLGFATPLQGVLGGSGAHRLFLSLCVIGFLAGALYLAGSGGRERMPLGLLVFPFAFNWYLTSGFYNFATSIPGFCFAVGLMMRSPAMPWPRALALLGLGLFTALGHPLTVLCIGASALAVLPAWRARFIAALALLPAVALVGLGVSGGASPSGLEWPGGFPSPLYNIATAFYRFAVPIGMGELPAAIPAFLLLLFPAVLTAWRFRTEKPPVGIRLSALLLLLFFLLPERSFDLDHICTRMVGFLALSVPAWAGYGWLLRRRRLFFGAVAALSLGSTALFTLSAREVNADLAEYTAGIDAVPKGKTLFPLNFDARSGNRVIWPLLHAWGYYGVAKDLVLPHVMAAHATRPASLLAYRRDAPPLPDPDDSLAERLASGAFCRAIEQAVGREADCRPFVEEAFRDLVAKMCRYEMLLTWAAPPDVPARLSPCFRPVFEKGRLAVYERVRQTGTSAHTSIR